MNIDVDKTKQKINNLIKEGNRPPLVMFGGSVLLFPQPIKELSDFLHDQNIKICYDAAHVAGLIAGGVFQDPLREGADVVTASTHKTIPGPQGGLILSWNKYADQIKKSTFPGNTSNHHLHHVAAKTVVMSELLEFGTKYAKQIIKNSKMLAETLSAHGFNVLGANNGFTESHIIIIDITKFGDGGTIEKLLEKANIIINRNLLPYDLKQGRNYLAPGGIRLGSQECTRLGMKEQEMIEIANLIKRLIINNENPLKIRSEVNELKSSFQTINYCFKSNTKAYEYINIQ